MRYYPVFLDIAGKPVVVVGGGHVALQKVQGLVDAGADVTVISPDLLQDLREFADSGRIRHVVREYQHGDLEGYKLAFVATDDRSINAVVTEEGRQRGVWVNAVDDPPNCDFIMPGVIRNGDIVVAVSTSGKSPAMARKLREDLQAFLGEDDSQLLELAARVRLELTQKGIAVKSCDRCDRSHTDVWNAALDPEVKRLLSAGDEQAAKSRLVRSLLAPSDQA